MDNLVRLIEFLEKVEESGINYRLNKIRDSILVEIKIPDERWEVEFMYDGSVVIEKFIADLHKYDESELENLFEMEKE